MIISCRHTRILTYVPYTPGSHKMLYYYSDPTSVYNYAEDLNLFSDFRSDKHPHIPTYMAPCFHTWGVRIKQHSKLTGPANLMENFVDHRLVSWKGSKPKHMLHLTDALKLKMGRAVVEYFKVIYRMKEDSYRSKNEALTHRSTKSSKM